MKSSEMLQIPELQMRPDAPLRPAPHRLAAAGEPAIDLDRIVWDLEYRAEVRAFLKTKN